MLGIEAAKGWVDDIALEWQEIPGYKVDNQKLTHLAIICDGNRRAALERGFEPHLGHLGGVEVIKGIARAARSWEIKHITFWTWSTENWQRDRKQIDFVMGLAQKHLSDPDFLQELVENKAKFTHLGRKDRLPASLLRTMTSLETATDRLNNYWLNLAMDYGGLDELSRAVIRMQQAGIKPDVIQKTPTTLIQFLDTSYQPPVDLVIRTGMKKGELPHISGFMPLQTAYAVWDFIPAMFPNLTPEILLGSIKKFEGYEKRLGS